MTELTTKGFQTVTYEKDGRFHFIRFVIPHEDNGEIQKGLGVTITADDATPTWMWMEKLRLAFLALAELVETNGLNKHE